MIMDSITDEFPDHDILTEETETKRTGARWLWLIDPLDGTVNFSRGYPFFCVSLALMEDKRLLAALVKDPYHDETFHSIAGKGAFLNNDPIKVSHSQTLRKSLVATGFPYDRAESPENNVAEFSRIAPKVQGIRRGGSAAMDLCYVASGRLDGFWELKLKPWDMAAGMLIIQEAGGKVTDDRGESANPGVHCIVATNGRIHGELIKVLGRV
jgi:myo-inositol-1(or 4)-monophosphatase